MLRDLLEHLKQYMTAINDGVYYYHLDEIGKKYNNTVDG